LTDITDAEPSAPVTEVTLAIRGMTCAACAARVERKLGELPGVTASVNVATEKAIVTAPSSVLLQRLIEAVQQAGYAADVLLVVAGAQQPETANQYLKRRLWRSLQRRQARAWDEYRPEHRRPDGGSRL
jgi:P-type Cu+ transporter